MNRLVKDIVFIIVGALLYALVLTFLVIPNNLADGGLAEKNHELEHRCGKARILCYLCPEGQIPSLQWYLFPCKNGLCNKEIMVSLDLL